MTARGERQMTTVKAVARHHDRPVKCWRCCSSGCLERAHLIDRSRDGLDGPQNLALLCASCHKMMPSFGPGEEDAAREYAMPAHPGISRYIERLMEVIGFDLNAMCEAASAEPQ